VHRLLQRQLKRNFGKEYDVENFPDEWKAFLQIIDETYQSSDQERRFLENTIDLNSEELYVAKRKVDEKNEELQQVNSSLEVEVANRTQELLEAKHKAEEANMAKSLFLANMSHELRTPLNAIMGFAQIIEQMRDLSDRHRLFNEKIYLSGQNMLVLVNTLLDFSKIEDGKVEFRPIMFSLGQLISELRVLFELLAKEKNITINYPDQVSAIYADYQLIKQVFINLISNAVKFSPVGSMITMTFKETEDFSHFSIMDQGDGIKLEESEKLFQPFSQGDASKNLPLKGTGLGLSLSRSIIETIHHGKIWVESVRGEGSTFYVQIPK
jgi:signal transduction histidine kinase